MIKKNERLIDYNARPFCVVSKTTLVCVSAPVSLAFFAQQDVASSIFSLALILRLMHISLLHTDVLLLSSSTCSSARARWSPGTSRGLLIEGKSAARKAGFGGEGICSSALSGCKGTHEGARARICHFLYTCINYSLYINCCSSGHTLLLSIFC